MEDRGFEEVASDQCRVGSGKWEVGSGTPPTLSGQALSSLTSPSLGLGLSKPLELYGVGISRGELGYVDAVIVI